VVKIKLLMLLYGVINML